MRVRVHVCSIYLTSHPINGDSPVPPIYVGSDVALRHGTVESRLHILRVLLVVLTPPGIVGQNSYVLQSHDSHMTHIHIGVDRLTLHGVGCQ